jgi:hypothetical protein
MAWLPEWVKEEYLDFLWEISGPEGRPRDDATLTIEERVSFYEKILSDKQCRGVWKTLHAYRHLAEAHLGAGTDGGYEINQIADVLQAAHMSYRGYSPLEALTKKERDALGDSIGRTARKLSNLMGKLWTASPEDERDYPTAFAGIRHEVVQALLSEIESAAGKWVKSERVVIKPGSGDARRRYFMCSMADWFETIYEEAASGGFVRANTFDSVVTAMTNCLFADEEGGIDQPTVTKVLDAAKAAKAGL